MTVSVYLHEEVYSVLRCFGTLNDVTNKILDACSKGEIELMDKPAAPNRSGASRYDVVINNEDYVSLVRRFGPRSQRVSLRRLLYWFVEEEIYELLCWEMSRDYITSRDEKTKKSLQTIQDTVMNLRDRSDAKYYDKLTEIMGMLEELRNA